MNGDKYPVVKLQYGGKYNERSPEVVDADEFIGVKSHRAKGKRLSNLTLAEVVWLEPLRKEPETDAAAMESVATTVTDVEVEGEESVSPGEDNQLELF